METKGTSWATVLAGVRYVWENKTILGMISLDPFAVLLGGAVALMPVFAQDVLHTGAWGLGILRSAPAIGAAWSGYGSPAILSSVTWAGRCSSASPSSASPSWPLACPARSGSRCSSWSSWALPTC
jgi:hypothetical protein